MRQVVLIVSSYSTPLPGETRTKKCYDNDMGKIIVLVVIVFGGMLGYSTAALRIAESELRRAVRDCISAMQADDVLKNCAQVKAERFKAKVNPGDMKVTASEPYNASTMGSIIVQKRTLTIEFVAVLKRGIRSKTYMIKAEGDVVTQSKVVAPNDPSRIKLDQ